MNKKKIIIIGLVVLALVTAIAIAVPVMADAANATPAPTQLTPVNKAGALLRLLLVQDQTKAFAYVCPGRSSRENNCRPGNGNRQFLDRISYPVH